MTRRSRAGVAAGIIAFMVGVAGAGCVRLTCAGRSRLLEQQSAASGSVQAPLRGRHQVPVGAGPSELLLVDGGRTLVCKNIEEHSLSLIDLATRREVARVRLPVTERGPDGKPTHGYLAGLAEDRANATLWAVSNQGQIFSVDLRACRAATRHASSDDSSIATDFLAAAWDPDRSRLLISAGEAEEERGVLLAFASGRIQDIAATRMPIWHMQRRGSMLFYVSSRSGVVDEGAFDSAVGAFDLANDRTVFENDLASGFVESLAILPDGHVLVADSGMGRLLEYSAQGILRITREIGDRGPVTMHAGGRRVAVMERGRPVRPVLIYRMTDGGLSPSPVQEFPIQEGELGGVLALPGGGLAVSLHRAKTVLLLGEDQAKPFLRFPVATGEQPGAGGTLTTGR